MILKFTNKSVKSYFKIFFLFEENKINKELKKYNIKKPKIIDDFKKLEDEIYNFVYNNEYIILVGLGKKRDINIDKFDKICQNLKIFLSNFNKNLDKSIFFNLNDYNNHFILDQILGISKIYYKFNIYKSKKKLKNKKKTKKIKNTSIFINNYNNINNLKINNLLNSINFVKDLGNEPANILNPTSYIEIIKKRSKLSGFNCKIYDEKYLEKKGMNLILTVGKGSKYPSYLVELSLKNTKNKDKIVLIGKGITYDTGGINLKRGDSMIDMKTDMLGSATVLGIFDYLAKTKCKKNIIGFLPICENMIGENAVKPTDIVESYSGKTVEIMNTDAEGRLIIADVLTFAQEFNPKIIIDIATLTGQQENISCHLFANILGNNKELINELIKYGDKNNERLIELPLYEVSIKQTQNSLADVKNHNFGCNSSIIHGAAFLSNFVNNFNVKWAHLDIAGPSFIDNLTTGFGIRLLSDYIDSIIKN